jgi:hypothetical protein
LNDSFSNADVSNDAAPKTCSGEADCKTPDFCTNAFTCEYHFCKPIGPPSCDDQIDCTVDSCDTVNAACLHVPSDTSCGNGKTCDPGSVPPSTGCVATLACNGAGDTICARLDTDQCKGTWTCDPILARCKLGNPPNCTGTDACADYTCVNGTSTGYECRTTPRYDYTSDTRHCGGCNMACPQRLNATATCGRAACIWICNATYVDMNGDLNDPPREATGKGCECHVTADTSNPDLPDLAFQDTNCDGIDGTIANAIFVSPNGDDLNDGTMSSSKKTLAVAISLAAGATPKKDVYADMGTYGGSVTMVSGVSLYGGFNAANKWSRSLTSTSIIQGDTPTGVLLRDASERTEVQLFTIRATDAGNNSESSYGVRIVSSPGPVTVRACEIHAGSGRGGASGTAGAAGSDGGPATGATAGVSACGVSGGAGGPLTSGATKGNAGSDGTQTANGGYKGIGGAGGQQFGECMKSGTKGTDGTPGTPGTAGTTGANGGAASDFGAVAADGTYTAADGFDGSGGTNGGGGGGGGSGGGDSRSKSTRLNSSHSRASRMPSSA